MSDNEVFIELNCQMEEFPFKMGRLFAALLTPHKSSVAPPRVNKVFTFYKDNSDRYYDAQEGSKSNTAKGQSDVWP